MGGGIFPSPESHRGIRPHNHAYRAFQRSAVMIYACHCGLPVPRPKRTWGTCYHYWLCTVALPHHEFWKRRGESPPIQSLHNPKYLVTHGNNPKILPLQKCDIYKMAKGAGYNVESFLLSVIKHSDLKVWDQAAVGAEHGITAHSAYCRYNSIRNKLKADLEAERGEESKSAPVTPKRGRKRASPGSASKAQNVKEEEVDDEESTIKAKVKTFDGDVKVEQVEPESPTKRIRVKKEVVKREIGVKKGRSADDDDDESDYRE
ncbi:hypothetical protein Dda_3025 [Drechslerella dactyloides]|uniref:Myb-like DNA-binding domain-containing protein n=1 Tax=Drechslerella dactyloides TaxID=74499 RepID=A0AAD6J0P6_DREDA|nr:hypothetical protein Dda_3025 [Drechslerella dactyloides]